MVVLVGGITFAAVLVHGHLAEQRQARARVLHDRQPRPHRRRAPASARLRPSGRPSFLILFHAIAKSLLFLCVGTAEHHIGSRDIEDMDLLFERMPRLARFMMLGIMCMFIAPFGMLVAKWADARVVRGHGPASPSSSCWPSARPPRSCSGPSGSASSPASPAEPENVEVTVHSSEWTAIVAHGRARDRAAASCLPHHLASSSWSPTCTASFGVRRPGHRVRRTCGSPPSPRRIIAIVLFAGLGRRQGQEGRRVPRRRKRRQRRAHVSATRFRGESRRHVAQHVSGRHLRREAHQHPSARCLCTIVIIVASFATAAVALAGPVLGKEC